MERLKNEIFLSVIVPSLNQDDYIEETILSVIQQNYTNFELIIIDGGSTDNTINIIKKHNKNISYWESTKDLGTWHAINKGLKRMKGEYFCIVNSDDLLLKDTFKKINSFINENTGSLWIAGGVVYIDKNSVEREKHLPTKPPCVSGLTFINWNWLYHPAVFLHSSIIKKYGYFDNSEVMDYDYWLKLEHLGLFPSVINEPLAALRFHPHCKTFNYLKMYDINNKLLEDYLKKHKSTIKHPHQLKERIKQGNILYYRTKIQISVFNKKLLQAVKFFFILFAKSPSIITKTWFWKLSSKIISCNISESEFNPFYKYK